MQKVFEAVAEIRYLDEVRSEIKRQKRFSGQARQLRYYNQLIRVKKNILMDYVLRLLAGSNIEPAFIFDVLSERAIFNGEKVINK